MKHRTFFELAICPHCGASHDAHTAVSEDARPEPGDASICFKCGDVAEFGPDLRLLVPGDDRLAEFMADPDIQRTRAMLRGLLAASAS